MRIIILYTTRHGTSQKIARTIQHSSRHQVSLYNLRHRRSPDLTQYEIVIIGSSVHSGKIPLRLRRYMRKHKSELMQRNLALYLCCMELDKAKMHIENNYPDELRQHAFATACLGGEFLFDKLSREEKAEVKKLTGAKTSRSKIRHDALQNFIRQLGHFSQRAMPENA
ncbi:MAG: flavodoxin domain-containing protein [Bacteroidota bacterium]